MVSDALYRRCLAVEIRKYLEGRHECYCALHGRDQSFTREEYIHRNTRYVRLNVRDMFYERYIKIAQRASEAALRA